MPSTEDDTKKYGHVTRVLSTEDDTQNMYIEPWADMLSTEDDTQNMAMGQVCYLLKMTHNICTYPWADMLSTEDDTQNMAMCAIY